MVAAYALGLTPLVFLVASLLFVLTTLTYFEGMTLYPERGGSAVMARYGFNELLSFVAGWAILLDFLILIAISALSIGHYLTAFWSKLGDDGVDLAIALRRAVRVARYNYLGLAPRGRRSAALAIVDLALVLADRRARARRRTSTRARSPTASSSARCRSGRTSSSA